AGPLFPAAAAAQGKIEGLFAQPVARQEEPLVPAIPDSERKHAVDALDELISPLEIGAQHHLGIASRRKEMTAGLKGALELLELVGLAVEDDGAILAKHGLSAASDVEDRQAAVTQAGGAIQEEALVVRSPVSQDVRHPAQSVCVRLGVEPDFPRDATHAL